MIAKLIIATLLTGVISGFFITFYEMLIAFTTRLLFMGDPFETIPVLPTWYLYVVPTVAIFIVNYLISKDNYIREYGLTEIADSVSQNKLIINVKTLFLKVIASTLSVSSGYAVGTEGPSAGMGAMVAYQIHRLFNLPIMLVKMMISVGASSGIAAIFVSPLTGIVFSIENIAYQFIKQYIGYVILGSVIAFSISVKFLDSISFHSSLGKEFDYYYVMPILIFIPFITIFIYLYLFMKKRLLHIIDLEIFKKFRTMRNMVFSLIGGSVIGTILLIEPHAGFSGKEIVMHLINNKESISVYFIFLIIILRIVGTTVSLYANAVGGLFLPLMSIGALVGYGYGEIITFYSHFPFEPFFFAAVGSAVFMGVVMKLPLTAVVLALELTFDYNILVATGVSVVLVGYLTSLQFNIRRKYVTQAEESSGQTNGSH
ncbi:voltage-gated chloride channel [Sulfurovum lithotrophicum]|uniref:Voltage-gated chloride channel n=1 Tax=Sulfurovum lithotrophicum TaxID=206403 RepID=A0A7U4RPS4_9BACT|nr:chloride channel protein [Sulfurovum lithotrophicum]AKF24088.1 voltage-gated chloride channel [Sulfurovum lithotrophicum]